MGDVERIDSLSGPFADNVAIRVRLTVSAVTRIVSKLFNCIFSLRDERYTFSAGPYYFGAGIGQSV